MKAGERAILGMQRVVQALGFQVSLIHHDLETFW
jgi:hypothetical protein